MEMQDGALAMLDALGFKGIWQRYDAQRVIEKLESLQAAATDVVDRHRAELREIKDPDGLHGLANLTIRAQFLSDTIVIGVGCSNAFVSCIVAGVVASEIMGVGAHGEPALAYRGAIAQGKHIINNNFIIGEAVDDAAKHMDLADGAFVWLTPSARRAVVDNLKLKHLKGVLVPYQVPMKNGVRYDTLAVAPFYQMDENPTGRAHLAESILDTFTARDLSIEIKRQNTDAFLRYVADSIAGR
jgi:hypothetical protein